MFHVKDVAVRFAFRFYLLDHVLGLDVTAFFKRKVRLAKVSRASRGAAYALNRQDCVRAHRCDYVSVKVLRDFVGYLPPKVLLGHPPGVLDPHPCQLLVEFRREQEDVPTALRQVLQRWPFVLEVGQVAENRVDVHLGCNGRRFRYSFEKSPVLPEHLLSSPWPFQHTPPGLRPSLTRSQGFPPCLPPAEDAWSACLEPSSPSRPIWGHHKA